MIGRRVKATHGRSVVGQKIRYGSRNLKTKQTAREVKITFILEVEAVSESLC